MSGQNVSTSAYRRQQSFYMVSVDQWTDIFRNASRSIAVVSAGALDADCSMPIPFLSIASFCPHSLPLIPHAMPLSSIPMQAQTLSLDSNLANITGDPAEGEN